MDEGNPVSSRAMNVAKADETDSADHHGYDFLVRSESLFRSGWLEKSLRFDGILMKNHRDHGGLREEVECKTSVRSVISVVKKVVR